MYCTLTTVDDVIAGHAGGEKEGLEGVMRTKWKGCVVEWDDGECPSMN